MFIHIDTSDLRAAVEEANRALPGDVRAAVARACEVGESTAKVTAPHRTYELRDSIDGQVLSSDASGATGELRATAEHASYVRDGTPPHEITPRRGRFLRFEVGGKTVFATKVNHPGTKPNDFWKRAAEKAEDVLEREAQRAADQFAARVNR